ncbi:MAG: tRNA 2-thiouridine(34) synthase MnmA [Planctomycetota bacterium]
MRTGEPIYREPGKGDKVLVAMSGGVDSSVAAAMLLARGCDVVGVFMRLGSPGESLDEMTPYDEAVAGCDPSKIKIGHQGCCSVGDAADARLVAAQLGIPLYVCNFKKDFGRIIDHFVDEYASGRTPNPCVRCNDWLKFGKLHDYAHQIGAGFVASGHHARVEARGGQPALLRGADFAKDQSYVLFGAGVDRLSEMSLPVGQLTKAQVRAEAERLGLPTFDKPESQEICFVPDNDYAGLVERRRPGVREAGTILNEDGEVVGAHEGQHKFTIGQRRGVGVAFGYPIFVVDKDPEANTITVGKRESLAVEGLTAREANWLVGVPSGEIEVIAQHRAHGEATRATVRTVDPEAGDTPSGRRGRFDLTYAEPVHGVAPGQAIVLYDLREPDRVLGGGWIAATTRAGEGNE